MVLILWFFFFFKQKTAYEMRISDWSSDVCSSDLFSIAGRRIGPSEPPYVIAEMCGNHNGDIGRALRILEAAKQAGADAVKLQTYPADTITIDVDGPEFRIEDGLWHGRRLYDLYDEAHTPVDWHGPKIGRAHVCTPVNNENLVCRHL